MSTLYVDNLQPNLGSGVSIPGHVIQVQEYVGPYLTTFSTGETAILTASFTPLNTGSKLYVSGMSPRYQNNSSTGIWHSSAYLSLKQDSVTVAAFEHVGTQSHSGESAENVPFSYTTSASSVAGIPVVFTLMHQPTNGGTSLWYFGRTTPTANAYTRMTIMEIAQ